MDIKVLGFGLGCLVMATSSFAASVDQESAHKGVNKKHYSGFVAHGINTYNGSSIGDYSKVAPGVAMFNSPTAVLEIGALAAPGSLDSNQITPATDRSTPVATTRSFFDFFNPGAQLDTSLVNVTLDQIPTSYFGYTGNTDRVVPQAYEAGLGPIVYQAKKLNTTPTVGEWESIQGRMTVKERADGTAFVKVTIKNAIPFGIYTLWDVGVTKPSTNQAAPYAVPLGGIPNILNVNKNGCAVMRFEMPYSPSRSCEAGAESCSGYISAFYHWDGQVYGGAPAATWDDAPVGLYGSNQIVFATAGDLLQEPSAALDEDDAHGCR
jgi:hypothetical protein